MEHNLSQTLPVEEFLECVQKTCNTLQKNQIDILRLFRFNLENIKAKVQSCIDQVKFQEKVLITDSKNLNVTKENFENRDLNIVIHGLSKADVGNVNGLTFVSLFLLNELSVDVVPERVKIVPSKNENIVIIITLASKDDKRKIFGNCHRLKSFHKKVSITDDKAIRKCDLQSPSPNSPRRNDARIWGQEEVALIGDSIMVEVAPSPDNPVIIPKADEIGQQHAESIEGEEEAVGVIDTSVKTVPISESSTEECKLQQKKHTSGVFDKSKEESWEEDSQNFWMPKYVKRKYKQLRRYAERYCMYDDSMVETIWNLHGSFFKEKIKTEECVCHTLHVVPSAYISREMSCELNADYITKQEDTFKLIKQNWEKQFQDKCKVCFCQKVLK